MQYPTITLFGAIIHDDDAVPDQLNRYIQSVQPDWFQTMFKDDNSPSDAKVFAAVIQRFGSIANFVAHMCDNPFIKHYEGIIHTYDGLPATAGSVVGVAAKTMLPWECRVSTNDPWASIDAADIRSEILYVFARISKRRLPIQTVTVEHYLHQDLPLPPFLFKAITTPKPTGGAFNRTEVVGDLIVTAGKTYIHPRSSLIRIDGELGRGPFVLHEVLPHTIRPVIPAD